MRAGGRGGMPCKTHVLCLLVCRLDDERSECPEEPEMLLDAPTCSKMLDAPGCAKVLLGAPRCS